MKFDRLLGILTVLLQNDRVTAPQLAAKFEVNRRTIGRDVDALCKAGIPVVTHQGSGGGISIAEGFKLDKTLVTAEELLSITTKPVIIDLASYYKGQLTKKIELLKRAVLERRVVEFDYIYEKGESRRRIEPHVVIFKWSAWYVFGFCLERQDWRMFKLLRLWNLVYCSDIPQFTPREIPPEQKDFDTRFTDSIKLVALFEHSEKYRLIESYGLNCYTETADGLLFEFGFENRGYLVSWLLGFGGNVKVLEPDYIADDLKAAAEKILLKHGEQGI